MMMKVTNIYKHEKTILVLKLIARSILTLISGGTLGLFTGMSISSIFELVYWFYRLIISYFKD